MKHRIALLSLVLLGACAPDAVTIDVNFPTTEAFMKSEQARLLVFPLEGTQLGVCPRLLDELTTQSFSIEAVYDSGLISVCALRGGTSLPDIGEGPHAYVVEVSSSSNRRILQGCSIGEIYVGAPAVQVALHPTTDYAMAATAPGTPDALCARGGS